MRRLCALIGGTWIAAACFVDHGPAGTGASSVSGTSEATSDSSGEPTDATSIGTTSGGASAGTSTSEATTTATSKDSDGTATASTTRASDSSDVTTVGTSVGTSDATTLGTSDATTVGTSDATTNGTSDATTDGGPVELTQACTDYCEALAACDLSTKSCVEKCLVQWTQDPNPSMICVATVELFLECAVGLPCNQILTPNLGCPTQGFQLLINCPACKPTVTPGMDACGVTLACQVDLYNASCTGTSCTCVKNDESGVKCEVGEAICSLSEDALVEAAYGCCEWP
ncbi:MAG: hypothetical protein R3B09_18595 [Nannocystaceae bacterium]